MILLLVIERKSEIWLSTRFGCGDAEVEEMEDIENYHIDVLKNEVFNNSVARGELILEIKKDIEVGQINEIGDDMEESKS